MLVQIVGLLGDVARNDLCVARVGLTAAGHALGVMLDVTRIEDKDFMPGLLGRLNHTLVVTVGCLDTNTRPGRQAGKPLINGRC